MYVLKLNKISVNEDHRTRIAVEDLRAIEHESIGIIKEKKTKGSTLTETESMALKQKNNKNMSLSIEQRMMYDMISNRTWLKV